MTLTVEQSSHKDEYESLATKEVIKRIRTAMGEGCIRPAHVYDLVDEALDRLDRYDGMLSRLSHFHDVPMKKLLAMPVDNLEFCCRICNCLTYNFINTIGDLIKYTESDLLKKRGIGKDTVAEIKNQLRRVGLSLKGEE